MKHNINIHQNLLKIFTLSILLTLTLTKHNNNNNKNKNLKLFKTNSIETSYLVLADKFYEIKIDTDQFRGPNLECDCTLRFNHEKIKLTEIDSDKAKRPKSEKTTKNQHLSVKKMFVSYLEYLKLDQNEFKDLKLGEYGLNYEDFIKKSQDTENQNCLNTLPDIVKSNQKDFKIFYFNLNYKQELRSKFIENCVDESCLKLSSCLAIKRHEKESKLRKEDSNFKNEFIILEANKDFLATKILKNTYFGCFQQKTIDKEFASKSTIKRNPKTCSLTEQKADKQIVHDIDKKQTA